LKISKGFIALQNTKQHILMKLAIGSDHAGFGYKAELITFLEQQGHLVTDFGTNSENSADYADFAHQVAQAVENETAELGILLCGSGNGICMTANKHQQIRAALCWTAEIAELSRQHNNANVLCMPARFVTLEVAKEILTVFLKIPFEGGRHLARINKIPC